MFGSWSIKEGNAQHLQMNLKFNNLTGTTQQQYQTQGANLAWSSEVLALVSTFFIFDSSLWTWIYRSRLLTMLIENFNVEYHIAKAKDPWDFHKPKALSCFRYTNYVNALLRLIFVSLLPLLLFGKKYMNCPFCKQLT